MRARKGVLLGFDIGLMIMMFLCKLSFERLAPDKRNIEENLNLVHNTQYNNFNISWIHKDAAYQYKYDKNAEVTKIKIPSRLGELSKNEKDETSRKEKDGLDSSRNHAFGKIRNFI